MKQLQWLWRLAKHMIWTPMQTMVEAIAVEDIVVDTEEIVVDIVVDTEETVVDIAVDTEEIVEVDMEEAVEADIVEGIVEADIVEADIVEGIVEADIPVAIVEVGIVVAIAEAADTVVTAEVMAEVEISPASVSRCFAFRSYVRPIVRILLDASRKGSARIAEMANSTNWIRCRLPVPSCSHCT